jgi:hypothetical protein
MVGQIGREWLVRQVGNGWSDTVGREWLARQVENGWSDR